jgi:hypothetical protein
MMKFLSAIIAIILLFVEQVGLSQGFVNLNFEAANLSAYGTGPAGVSTKDAIPHWTAYIEGQPLTDIVYNTVALDDSAVSIHGTNSSSVTPIQGKYSILLQGGTQYSYSTNSAIGQTGQIPVNALSLVFWGYISPSGVTFDGQTLSLAILGNTPNYNIYGADISAFAGQTGQLLFTASKLSGALIDNIQFSTTAVPEPSAFALTALGGLLLGYRRWKP